MNANDLGSMKELADAFGEYIKKNYVDPAMKDVVRYYRAQVSTAPDESTARMAVRKPGDAEDVSLRYTASASSLAAGDQCTVFVLGNHSNAVVFGDGTLHSLGENPDTPPTPVDPDVYVYSVTLDSNGAISSVDPNLTYSAVKAILTDGTKQAFLKIRFSGAIIYARADQEYNTTSGPINFFGIYLGPDQQLRLMEFMLSTADALSVYHFFLEHWMYKVQDIVANSTNELTYPSTKAVYTQFRRKPVEVWRAADDASMLKAIQANLSASPAWQLTGLDLTPYKRIKIYSKCGQNTGTTASASTTAAMVLEILLDSSAAIAAYGGNYCGSVISQKPNDNNRLATLTCAVSADKTSFVVLRQTNLYGTAATGNDDVNADVFLIEGYYD